MVLPTTNQTGSSEIDVPDWKDSGALFNFDQNVSDLPQFQNPDGSQYGGYQDYSGFNPGALDIPNIDVTAHGNPGPEFNFDVPPAPPPSGLGSIDGYGGPPTDVDISALVKHPDNIPKEQKPWYDRIWNGVKEAVKNGVYDLAHPAKALQDIIHHTTGINFADGTYTMPDDQDPSDFPNIDWHSDPTFKPTGINPLTAASNIPGFGTILSAANLAIQAAGYDPSFNFGNSIPGHETTPPGNTQYASNNTQGPVLNAPGGGNGGGGGGTQISAAPPNYGLGSTSGGNDLGLPNNVIVPQIATPQQNVPAGGSGAAGNITSAIPAAYHPYAGDYTKYGQIGQGGEHQFIDPMKLARGGMVHATPQHMAAGRAALMARRGQVSGPGTGKSDDVPTMLSDGEHVIDAATVSAAGDGSNDKGHKVIELFKQTIRKHAGQKNPKKPTPKQPGLGSLMRVTMGAR